MVNIALFVIGVLFIGLFVLSWNFTRQMQKECEEYFEKNK